MNVDIKRKVGNIRTGSVDERLCNTEK